MGNVTAAGLSFLLLVPSFLRERFPPCPLIYIREQEHHCSGPSFHLNGFSSWAHLPGALPPSPPPPLLLLVGTGPRS